MYKLRIWLSVLIAWLVLFYNIERVTEPLNIASFVYVFVPVTAGIVLLVPRVSKRTYLIAYIIFILLIYVVLKFIFPRPSSLFISAAIIEVVSIIFTVVLVKQVGNFLWDFEDTIENLTFHQIGLPPRLYETTETEDLYREVKRSRRFRHSLSLLVLRPQFDPRSIQLNRVMVELQKTMAERYIQARVAKLLSDTLRDIDLVVVSGQEYIVMLPETDAEEAQKTSVRLQRAVTEELGIDVAVGSAAFPQEAVTLRGLIETATTALDPSRKPERVSLTTRADT
ncbi:MAG: hypothetical protein IT326_02915 [Anaerolineae bacterium]|nr:hypothetical protein [Anaerolineae bacterium]